MPTIGDKMRTRPPVPLRGQPESNWFRVEEQFEAEVKQYLEDSTLADAIAALETAMAALTLRVAALEDFLGDIADAVITNPDGSTSLRTYDARMERVMDALLELLMDVRERMRVKQEETRNAQ